MKLRFILPLCGIEFVRTIESWGGIVETQGVEVDVTLSDSEHVKADIIPAIEQDFGAVFVEDDPTTEPGFRLVDTVALAAGDALGLRFRGDKYTEGATAADVAGCIDMVQGDSITQVVAANQMEAVTHKGFPAFKVDHEGATVAKQALGNITQFSTTGDNVVYLIVGEWEQNDTTSSPGQLGPFGSALFEPLFLTAMPTSYPYASIKTQSAGTLTPNLPAEVLVLDEPHLFHTELMSDRARVGLDGVYGDSLATTGGCLQHSYAKVGTADPAADIIAYYWEYVVLVNPTATQTLEVSQALAAKYGVVMA